MIGILIALFAGFVVPSSPAPAHVMFHVTDNGGVLVTTHQLAPGQEIYCGGIAYTVHQVQDDHGAYLFTVTPHLGKSGTCST